MNGLLARIGRRTGWEGGDARARSVLLMLAHAGLLLSVVALVLTWARADGLLERGRAISPVTVTGSQEPVGLWRSLPFDLVGGEPVTVVAIRATPGAHSTPLPPGLTRLPEPGTAILSPQLRADLTDQPARYGTVVGTIGSEGLPTPTDRIVYVNPPAMEDARFTPVVAYGAPVMESRLASRLYRPDQLSVTSVTLLFGVFPCLAGVVAAVLAQTQARRRRTRLLDRLGATRSSLARVSVVDVAIPLLVANVVALASVVAACVVDLPLPWLRTVLDHRDALAWLPALLAGMIAADLLTLGAAVVAARSGDSARRVGRRRVRWRTAAHPRAAGILIVSGMSLSIISMGLPVPALRTYVFFLGVLLTCVGLPALLRRAAARLGATVGRRGLRAGSGSWLLGGRSLSADASGVGQMSSVVVVATVVATLAVGWATLLGVQYLQAVQDRGALPAQLLVSSVSELGGTAERFVAELPPGLAAVTVAGNLASNRPFELTGSCGALQALQLPCSTIAQSVAGSPYGQPLQQVFGPDLHYRVGTASLAPQPAPMVQLAILPTGAGPVDVPALEALQFRVAPDTIRLLPVGEEWTAAGALKQRQGDWLVTYAGVGLLVLLLGLAVSAISRAVAAAERAAPAVSIFGTQGLPGRVVVMRTGLPLAAAAVAGAALALGYSVLLGFGDRRWVVDLVPPLACLAVGIIGAVATTVFAAAACTTRSEAWRPGQSG